MDVDALPGSVAGSPWLGGPDRQAQAQAQAQAPKSTLPEPAFIFSSLPTLTLSLSSPRCCVSVQRGDPETPPANGE